MGGSCGRYWYGEEEWCIEGFVGEAVGKQALGGRKLRWGIILKWIFNKLVGRSWNLLSGSG
jgi:hypothetical protein